MRSIAVEPPSVAPEFLSASGCPGLPPFDTRFSLLVRSGSDLFIRRAGFEFVDRHGIRTIPTLLPTTPSSSAVPIPTTLNMVPVPAGTSRLPFALRFACGVRPAGLLLISLETLDAGGSAGTSSVTVTIGN
jgi:hypothetical protein